MSIAAELGQHNLQTQFLKNSEDSMRVGGLNPLIPFWVCLWVVKTTKSVTRGQCNVMPSYSFRAPPLFHKYQIIYCLITEAGVFERPAQVRTRQCSG